MKNISLIISLIGITLILFLINYTEPKLSSIENIKKNEIKITIEGEVTQTKVFESNFTIFKIKDGTGEIEVICNCPMIEKNQKLKILGKTSTYQGKLQINADKIILLK